MKLEGVAFASKSRYGAFGFLGEAGMRDRESSEHMTTNSVSMDMLASAKPSIDIDMLVEEHSDAMFRYAFQYVRQEDVARDLVQEALLSAIECNSSFEGRSAVRSWLIGILRHKALNFLRKRSREVPLDAQALEEKPLDEYFDNVEHWRDETTPQSWSSDPDNLLQQKQFLSQLHKCLERFPEKLRRLFLLREVDGCSREELCAEFELTPNHVGVVLHRVRLGLQQCLQVNWFRNNALRGGNL